MDGLRHNPAMREIGTRVTGANRFTETWVASVRARPDVAFIVGDARFTAASVEATPEADPTHAPVVVTLVPTASDDPLRGLGAPWAVGSTDVVLSARAAAELDLRAGGHVSLRIPRSDAGADLSQSRTLRITAVLPSDVLPERRVVLADSSFVLAVQEFRDGYAVGPLGWPGKPVTAGPPHFERFRMYARSIDDVERLTEWLQAQGIEPVSRVDDIAPVRALDHGLTVVLLIVASFAAFGLAVAIAATQVSAVQRKRRDLAVLTLIGYSHAFLIGMALLETALLTLAGIAVSVILFRAAGAGIDATFARVQRLTAPACQLGGRPLAAMLGVTLALALAASASAAWRIGRIEPARVLRET
jgi:putative ABC transport system permease protein